MKTSTTQFIRAAARPLGASALLASGGIHLDLYATGYHAIPTIGPMFLAQIVVAITLGFVLMFRSDQLLAAGGSLFALSTLGGYLLSRIVGLFGFHEVATPAGLVAGLLDTVAVFALGYFASSIRPDAVAQLRQIDHVRLFISSRAARAALPLVGGAALVLSLVYGVAGHVNAGAAAQTSSAGVKSVTIVINNFAFVPAYRVVQPGEQIRVHNEDSVAHTLTATPGAKPFGNFNTGNINPNQTKSFNAPTVPGTYHYLCSIHNFMTGVIVVKS
jgi:plastocyanin